MLLAVVRAVLLLVLLGVLRAGSDPVVTTHGALSGFPSRHPVVSRARRTGLIWKVVLSRGQGEAPALLGAGRAPLVSSGVAWLVSVSLVDARSD